MDDDIIVGPTIISSKVVELPPGHRFDFTSKNCGLKFLGKGRWLVTNPNTYPISVRIVPTTNHQKD